MPYTQLTSNERYQITSLHMMGLMTISLDLRLSE